MENQKPEKRQDVTLNGNVATYTVSHQTLDSGTLVGSFTFRTFLLPMQKLEAGRDRRRLLGEFEQFSTPQERYLAFVCAELRQRVLTSPSWFNPNGELIPNLADEALLFKIGDAALYAETLYQEVKEEDKKNLLERAMKESEKLLQKREEARQEELKRAKAKHEEDEINAEVEAELPNEGKNT